MADLAHQAVVLLATRHSKCTALETLQPRVGIRLGGSKECFGKGLEAAVVEIARDLELADLVATSQEMRHCDRADGIQTSWPLDPRHTSEGLGHHPGHFGLERIGRELGRMLPSRLCSSFESPA